MDFDTKRCRLVSVWPFWEEKKTLNPRNLAPEQRNLHPLPAIGTMQEPVKGTVTPLASLFPPEEAQKASKRVQDALADRQSELDRLQGFIADNTALVNLVQRLPDELHHDIMARS